MLWGREVERVDVSVEEFAGTVRNCEEEEDIEEEEEEEEIDEREDEAEEEGGSGLELSCDSSNEMERNTSSILGGVFDLVGNKGDPKISFSITPLSVSLICFFFSLFFFFVFGSVTSKGMGTFACSASLTKERGLNVGFRSIEGLDPTIQSLVLGSLSKIRE